MSFSSASCPESVHFKKSKKWVKPNGLNLNLSSESIRIFISMGMPHHPGLAETIAADMASHWNEPEGWVMLKNIPLRIEFIVRGFYEKDMAPETVWFNTDPAK